MPYKPPNFNLKCNVWRNGGMGGTYAAPDIAGQPCALSPGKRVILSPASPLATIFQHIPMELLLPKGADVRAAYNGNQSDLVECPMGTLRFYGVEWVDDSGRGYPNEYRIAIMVYLASGQTVLVPNTPAPVPLP